MDTMHLINGFSSPLSGDQMFMASFHTSDIGLFAPSAPSAYLRVPIFTGSKKEVAADVAKAASQIVAPWSSSSSATL